MTVPSFLIYSSRLICHSLLGTGCLARLVLSANARARLREANKATRGLNGLGFNLCVTPFQIDTSAYYFGLRSMNNMEWNPGVEDPGVNWYWGVVGRTDQSGVLPTHQMMWYTNRYLTGEYTRWNTLLYTNQTSGSKLEACDKETTWGWGVVRVRSEIQVYQVLIWLSKRVIIK